MESEPNHSTAIAQAINAKMEFLPESFAEIIRTSGFDKRAFAYNAVFILGCQSTGKSTLLNALFDTKFDVMVGALGRQQTTQGVWMGISQREASDEQQQRPPAILVFDVEGTDAAERGEAHVVFERKTSLFSLALSEILIINLMAVDVGRFEGANLGLLRTVFELNLQLFQRGGGKKVTEPTTEGSEQQQPSATESTERSQATDDDDADGPAVKKLLLFILRDHDGETPLEKLGARIQSDLGKVWDLLQKPPRYATSKINDFFDFEFVSLPHFKLQKTEWFAAVKDLRSRFEDSSHPRYLLGAQYKTDVPADGFGNYAEKIWDTIVHEKDLDIPTQKQMLAIYRCDEIRREAHAAVAAELTALCTRIIEERVIDETLGARGSTLLRTCLSQYDANATRYDRGIAASKRATLESEVVSQLREAYHVQQKLILVHCSEHASGLAAAVPKNEFQTDLMDRIKKLKDDSLALFTRLMDASLVPEAAWDYAREQEEAVAAIAVVTGKLKESQLSLWAVKRREETRKRLADSLRPVLDKADPATMWSSVKKVYQEVLTAHLSELTKLLMQFEYSEPEEEASINKEESVVFSALRDIIQLRVDHLGTVMIERFKKAFLEDENGPITWGYNDDLITPWKRAKLGSEVLVDLFAVIRLSGSKHGESGEKEALLVSDSDSTPSKTQTLSHSSGGDSASSSGLPLTQSAFGNRMGVVPDSAYCFYRPSKNGGEVESIESARDIPDELIIISPQQCGRTLEVFRSIAYTHYQMAQKDKEHASSAATIPHYFIALLLILGANEMWYVASMLLFNPIGLVFLLFVAGTLFVIYKLNLWGVVYSTVVLFFKQLSAQYLTQEKKGNQAEKLKVA